VQTSDWAGRLLVSFFLLHPLVPIKIIGSQTIRRPLLDGCAGFRDQLKCLVGQIPQCILVTTRPDLLRLLGIREVAWVMNTTTWCVCIPSLSDASFLQSSHNSQKFPCRYGVVSGSGFKLNSFASLESNGVGERVSFPRANQFATKSGVYKTAPLLRMKRHRP